MIRVLVTLENTSPLLMNPMSREKLLEIRDKQYKPKNRNRTLEQEAGEKLYRASNGKGSVGIPAENLMACLVAAGRNVQYAGKKNISNAESTILPAFLHLDGDFFPFAGKPKWEVDVRRGVNQDGGSNCIVRPKFRKWEMAVPVEIDESQEVSEETIRKLFDWAGRAVGLCDFRPAKKGIFGCFRVKQWKVTGRSHKGKK